MSSATNFILELADEFAKLLKILAKHVVFTF